MDLVTLLTEKEAAAYLLLAPRGLEAMRLHGRAPTFIRISHRCVRYRRADLDAWLDSKTIVPAPREVA